MQVGDLGRTAMGNLVIIVEVGVENISMFGGTSKVEWYNILFCDTGLLRTGYPADWLTKVEVP